ncbi:MAG TPA: hypothetical protein VKZ39_00425 [Sphaerochaetaceae bacterium]|nr:hypothetical protein [Sphaerochaetaceae bacterium]
MRRISILFLIFMTLLPSFLGARNLFEVGIGISGIYDTQHAHSGSSFFDGMSSGENWTIGVGLHSRLSIVNLSLLALLPTGTAGEQEQDALSIRSTLSFDIPLITDHLYMHLGGGLSTDFTYGDTERGSDVRVNGRSVSSTSFNEAVTSSTLHMKVGLDVLLGSAKLGMFYLIETLATWQGLVDEGSWSQLVQTSGQNRVGIQLQLALF